MTTAATSLGRRGSTISRAAARIGSTGIRRNCRGTKYSGWPGISSAKNTRAAASAVMPHDTLRAATGYFSRNAVGYLRHRATRPAPTASSVFAGASSPAFPGSSSPAFPGSSSPVVAGASSAGPSDADGSTSDGSSADGFPVASVSSVPSVSSVSGDGLERVKSDTRRSFRTKTAGGAPICTRDRRHQFKDHG